MWPDFDDRSLECQTCGNFITTLTPDQVQDMSHNPYRYVVDCRDCIDDSWKIQAEKDGLL